MRFERFAVFILTVLLTVTMLHTYVGADRPSSAKAGASDSESTGSESADSESDDSESSDQESSDPESNDSESSDSESSEQAASDSESSDSESADSEFADSESGRYYRSLLSEDERLVYDALVSCALSDDPSEEGDAVFLQVDPSGEAFKTMFGRVYNAVLYDHPELFWLNIGGSSFQYTYSNRLLDKDTYRISFSLPDPYPEHKEMMSSLEDAADEFLSDLDLSAPDNEVALAIHDKLIGLVTYDKSAVSGSSNPLAHTAYGALVAGSGGDSNTAVCDGYSGAYKYLLDKAGIQCLILAGHAGDDEESAGSHSWNIVNLDGDWYEVDATWDDISSEDLLDSDADYSELAEEASRNEWYMDKLTHYLFNVTTEEISYFEPDDYFTYRTDRGWVSFLKSSVHIRYTEEESEETGDYMTPLAPIAEGTRYSYREN